MTGVGTPVMAVSAQSASLRRLADDGLHEVQEHAEFESEPDAGFMWAGTHLEWYLTQLGVFRRQVM